MRIVSQSRRAVKGALYRQSRNALNCHWDSFSFHASSLEFLFQRFSDKALQALYLAVVTAPSHKKKCVLLDGLMAFGTPSVFISTLTMSCVEAMLTAEADRRNFELVDQEVDALMEPVA